MERFTLHPDRCDRCGACMAVCPVGAVNVGPTYIYVDWAACTSCAACVEACRRDAIVRPANASARGAASDSSLAERAGDAARPAESAASTKPVATASDGTAWRKSAKATSTAKPKPPSRSSSGVVAGWTLLDAVAVLSVLMLAMYAKTAVLGMGAISLMPFSGKVAMRVVVLVVFYALQIGVLAFLASRRNVGLLEAFGLRRVKGATGPSVLARMGSAGLAIALFLGIEFVAFVYSLAVEALGWAQPVRLSSDLTAVFGAGTAGAVLAVALVALVAPVVEELAFRGVVLNALGEKWGMWPAIIASALLFAASHLSLWMLLPTFVLGVALGWIAWTRRSLASAILLHMLYNSAAVVAAFMAVR
ncbi:MAG: CPBP family intramembrane metalloprotease [Coriobacteriia bacterium]|nr:CPBP family intramembrane metalloprotease [Coriobacteriia bacterium]